MQNIFIINPDASHLDINDFIIRKLEQAQSIITRLSDVTFCNNCRSVMGSIFAVGDLLGEIDKLYEIIYRKID